MQGQRYVVLLAEFWDRGSRPRLQSHVDLDYRGGPTYRGPVKMLTVDGGTAAYDARVLANSELVPPLTAAVRQITRLRGQPTTMQRKATERANERADSGIGVPCMGKMCSHEVLIVLQTLCPDCYRGDAAAFAREGLMVSPIGLTDCMNSMARLRRNQKPGSVRTLTIRTHS